MGIKKSLTFLEGVTTTNPNADDIVTLTGTQTLTNKTISGTLQEISTASAAASISSNTFAKPESVHVAVSGTGPLNTISGAADGDTLILNNVSGSELVITNNSGSGGFITGTGDNIELADDASLIVRYNNADSRWYVIGGTGAAGGAETKVNQTSHGFTVGQLVYFNGTNYIAASSTAANTAEVVGMVSRVDSVNAFRFSGSGVITGLSGLVAGDVYFLGTAGALTTTEPTTLGHVSLPVGVALSTTSLALDIKRGIVVGGTNARTQLSLSNNATTNIQDMAAYDAGEITGWVSIDGTTDLRFHTRIMFAKNGAGTNYNLNYETVGDTPPVGFNIDITSVGVIQLTLPSVTGFVSAFINYALNAPAVGTTFPLAVDGAAITTGTIAAARLPIVEETTQRAVLSAAYTSTSNTYVDSGLTLEVAASGYYLITLIHRHESAGAKSKIKLNGTDLLEITWGYPASFPSSTIRQTVKYLTAGDDFTYECARNAASGTVSISIGSGIEIVRLF